MTLHSDCVMFCINQIFYTHHFPFTYLPNDFISVLSLLWAPVSYFKTLNHLFKTIKYKKTGLLLTSIYLKIQTIRAFTLF